MSKRTATQKAAESAYREKFEAALIRLTPAEGRAIDKAKGALTRPAFIKQAALAVAGLAPAQEPQPKTRSPKRR